MVRLSQLSIYQDKGNFNKSNQQGIKIDVNQLQVLYPGAVDEKERQKEIIYSEFGMMALKTIQ